MLWGVISWKGCASSGLQVWYSASRASGSFNYLCCSLRPTCTHQDSLPPFSMFLRLASLGLWIAVISLSQALAISAASPGGVLYSLDNDARGAMIVAMSLSSNGTIVDTNMISTGGKGLIGTTGPGQPPVGNLFGADSVVVEDNVRYTFQ